MVSTMISTAEWWADCLSGGCLILANLRLTILRMRFTAYVELWGSPPALIVVDNLMNMRNDTTPVMSSQA